MFGGYKKFVKAGDIVIVQVNHGDKKVLTVTDGEITQTAKGALRHSGLIGLPYGSKYTATLGDVYVLFPTPELWTQSLPHRTQIIYSHDISLIVTELDLKPGDSVLESGTGSGSLTHALARAVMPNGKVHTNEFHLERARTARKEFEEHNISDVVQVYYRDVCQERNSSPDFTSEEIENGFPKNTKATACILDVPKPWLALKSAYNSMDRNQLLRFCCFSPCIEQVQKTVVFAYKNFGSLVREMKTVEFNVKTCNVKSNKLPMADLGLDQAQKENYQVADDPEGKARATLSGYYQTRSVVEKSQEKENGKMFDVDPKSNGGNGDPELETFFHYNYAASGSKIYGHTGYLTFFSIIPDLESKFTGNLFE